MFFVQLKLSKLLFARVRFATQTIVTLVLCILFTQAALAELPEGIVYFNGARKAYVGKQVKRRPPTADEFINISPGQSFSGINDVGLAYPMTIIGDCQICYQNHQALGNLLLTPNGGITLTLLEDRPVR